MPTAKSPSRRRAVSRPRVSVSARLDTNFATVAVKFVLLDMARIWLLLPCVQSVRLESTAMPTASASPVERERFKMKRAKSRALSARKVDLRIVRARQRARLAQPVVLRQSREHALHASPARLARPPIPVHQHARRARSDSLPISRAWLLRARSAYQER